MNSHVIYVALISIQPVAIARGHQFTSFFRKGVRRARPALLSITMRFFGLGHEDIKLHGEMKKNWKAPYVSSKRSNKKFSLMIKYDDSELLK